MIRFPKMHIAASVQNRILDIADEIAPASVINPSMPEPSPMGRKLDAQLTAPLPEMGAPDEAGAVAAASSATGGEAADALMLQSIAETLS